MVMFRGDLELKGYGRLMQKHKNDARIVVKNIKALAEADKQKESLEMLDKVQHGILSHCVLLEQFVLYNQACDFRLVLVLMT